MKKSDTTRRTSAKSATSRLLQAVAGDKDSAARLNKLGVTSVFDIARLPRERFVSQYYSAVESGGSTVEGEASPPVVGAEPADLHTLAVSYANQLLHLSRQVANVRPQPAMAPAAGGGLLQPFALADGVPTYQGQFDEDWASMCKPGAIEAMTSPVHYLVDLYKLACELEKVALANGGAIKLDMRRDDLKTLHIDEQSTYQEIPTLSLVLEILDKAIQNGNGAVVVDDVMAITRYPFQLPFDLWMKQISLVLQEQKTDLGRVIQQADAVAPYFPLGNDSDTQARALLASSQLSEEAHTLIGESDPSGVGDAAKSTFLWTNFGLFELNVGNPSDEMVQSLSSVSRFLEATSLTGSELDALFSQGNYKPKRSSAIKKPESQNDLRLLYGSAYINSGSGTPISSSEDTITGLTAQNLWKINKLIRLQRWTEVPFDRIDWMIRAATQANNLAFGRDLALDDRSVRAVGLFKRWRERYRIKPEPFCALIWQLNPYAAGNDTPFYDQLFGAIAGVRDELRVDDEEFDYTDSTSASVQTLCAGLKIKAEELALIGSIVAKAFGASGNKLQRTLQIFSALYRLVALPRLFGYNVREGQALLRILASVNPKWTDAIIKATPYKKNEVDVYSAMLTAEALVDWLQSHTMTPLAVEHALGLAEEFPVETEELVRFAQELGQQVQAVCLSAERFAQSGLPTEELADEHGNVKRIDWMKVLAALVDEQGLIKEVPTDSEGAGGKEGWHALPDYNPEFAIKHLHFVDEAHGWAQAQAADGSIDMLRSSDGGITWSKIAIEVEGKGGVPIKGNQVAKDARVFARAPDECWCIGTKKGTLLQIKGKHVYQRECDTPIDLQLHDVCFVNQIGWAVGEQGAVIKSVDGGKNWAKQTTLNTQANLFRVVFENEKNGWIGAKNNDTGTVYRTTSGGTSWTPQIPLDHAAEIDHLNFVDTTHGWARAQVGDLTKWHLLPSGSGIDPNLTIECLHFFDRHHGWAAAQQKDGAIQILQTDDSGTTWSKVDTPPVFYRSRVFAKGPDECWCIGNELGQLIQIKAKKGTVVPVSSNWRLHDICFIGNTGWAVGTKGVLLKNSNGEGWKQQASPNSSATFLRVSFLDDKNGWIGCGDAKGGAVYRTTDGGITWTTRSQGHASYIDHFGFVNAQTGWARTLGSQQDQWQLLPPLSSAEGVVNATDVAIKQLHFVDEKHGWAISSKNNETVNVIKTADGGQTWIFIETPKLWANTRVFARGVEECWCIADANNTLIQINGTTSKEVSALQGGRLQDVCFIGTELGFAVGEQGVLMKSTDGGQDWSKVTFPDTTAKLLRVTFQDEKIGWISGENEGVGTVYRTLDGGQTWAPRIIPLEHAARIDLLHFVDTQNGWARAQVGELGQWRALPNDYDQDFTIKSLHFADKCHGWAKAQKKDGTSQLLQSTDSGISWSVVTNTPLFSRSRIFAKGRNECWGIGNEVGQLIQIKDGQETVHDVSNGRLYDLCFFGEIGWAVGAKGTLLKSENGGQSWQQQSFLTKNATLLRVHFFDADHGWITGGDAASGVIYSTTNGGQSWTAKALEDTARLDHLSFVGAQTGWLSASNKEPGQWLNLSSPQIKDVTIKHLRFVDETHGWAIASKDNGTVNVIKTADGGQTWLFIDTPKLWANTRVLARSAEECWCIADANDTLIQINGTTSKQVAVPEGGRLHDVYFEGPAFNLGLAIGEQGVIMRSPNGGINWGKQPFADQSATLHRITFDDRESGWIGGEKEGAAVVYHSTDYGITWTPCAPLAHAVKIDQLHFADGKTGWAKIVKDKPDNTGALDGILSTQDGGLSWQEQKLPNLNHRPLRAFNFIDQTHGWLISDKEIFYTADGGQKWEALSNPLADANLQSIFMVDPWHGWIGATAGGLLALRDEGKLTLRRTTNAGADWQVPASTGLQGTIHDVVFTDSTNGWLVGEKGMIFHTTDGGENWSGLKHPISGVNVWSLFMLDATHGWIGGSAWSVLKMDDAGAHVLVRTRNGGVTWQERAIPELCEGPIRDIGFVDPYNGWLVSEKGTILRTHDGGSNWKPIENAPVDVAIDLWSISMVDAWHGWIGASKGCLLTIKDTQTHTLLRTWDGGTTWQAQAIPELGAHPINDVAFLDADKGWVVSEAGTILYTKDGGVTWAPLSLDTKQVFDTELRAICVLDPSHAWIGGAHGTLLTTTYDTQHRLVRTTNAGSNWQLLDLKSELGEDGLINDFQFVDQKNGWLVSKNGTILQTGDGGDSWSRISPVPLPSRQSPLSQYASLLSISFVDAEHGWIGGEDGHLLKNIAEGSGIDGLIWEVLAGLNLSEEDRKRCLEILTALFKSTQAAQNKCAYMAISKLFGPEPRQVPWLFSWMGKPVHDLLAGCLETMARQTAGIAPSKQRTLFVDLMYEISRYAVALNLLKLSDSALQRIIPYPERVAENLPPVIGQFLLLSAQSNPRLPLGLASLYFLSRLHDLISTTSQPEEMVLRYIETANGYDPYDTAIEDCTNLLAVLINWDVASIHTLFQELQAKLAKTLAEIDWILRCQVLSNAYGLPAEITLKTRGTTADYPVREDYKVTAAALIARYNDKANK